MLRPIAGDPAARGLMDDAALLSVTTGALVVTHDMIVEGVHYLPDDSPQSVAWKLVAVNLSDLAAKGAKPLGLVLGYALAEDAAWDAAFVAGLGEALSAFDVPLLGGDTVAMPAGAPRALGLTAFGQAPECGAPDRRSAQAGDMVWVTGTIGDAGLGLAIRQEKAAGGDMLVRAYTCPRPQLAFGQAVAPHVHAMADVSDGLLIDAHRIAQASGVAIEFDMDAIPLSPAFVEVAGSSLDARLEAAMAGDDYQLLFTAPAQASAAIEELGRSLAIHVHRIGRVAPGSGLSLCENDRHVAIPERLGYQHGVN